MFSYLKRMDWWGFIKSFGLPKPVMLKFFNNVTKLSTAQCFRYCGEKLIVSWGGPFPSTLKCYRYENAFILNVAVFLPELGHCHFPPHCPLYNLFLFEKDPLQALLLHLSGTLNKDMWPKLGPLAISFQDSKYGTKDTSMKGQFTI